MVLQAEVMIQMSTLDTTNKCWKVCLKNKSAFHNPLSTSEKECFHNCTLATLGSEQNIMNRVVQHIQHQAAAGSQ